MTPISKEQILLQLHWRYATKKFDPTRTIPEEDWQVLEKSLILSPSSFGLEPWKFFVVTHPDLRKQISAAAFHQSQITDASHLVILTVKRGIHFTDADALIKRTSSIRNIPLTALEGFKTMLNGFINKLSPEALDAWATRQVYIALGQFITTAACLGIDACPMEGFLPEKVDDLLGIKKLGYGSVVLCTAGYRHAEDKYAKLAKVRRQHDDVITYI